MRGIRGQTRALSVWSSSFSSAAFCSIAFRPNLGFLNAASGSGFASSVSSPAGAAAGVSAGASVGTGSLLLDMRNEESRLGTRGSTAPCCQANETGAQSDGMSSAPKVTSCHQAHQLRPGQAQVVIGVLGKGSVCVWRGMGTRVCAAMDDARSRPRDRTHLIHRDAGIRGIRRGCRGPHLDV